MSNQFLITNNGISGSLTHLADGTSYIKGCGGISILSQSNGSILISGSKVDNINPLASLNSCYGAWLSQGGIGGDTIDANFAILVAKISDIITKLNNS